MEYLEKVDTFFSYNLLIKKLLNETAPTAIEAYGEGVSGYPKRVEIVFKKILQCFEEIKNLGFISSYDMEFIHDFFTSLRSKLNACGDYATFHHFYSENVSSMRKSYVNKLNSECSGYSPFFNNYLVEAQSLNEILHSVHMGLVNDITFFKKAPELIKSEEEGHRNVLYGEDKLGIATYLFEHIPTSLKYSQLLMLSFQKGSKILMMLRNLGHATNVEVEIGTEQTFVSYHIPKVCNIEKVNKVRGVRKLNPLESDFRSGTTGEFVCATEDLVYTIQDFLLQIPTDNDIEEDKGMSCDSISLSA